MTLTNSITMTLFAGLSAFGAAILNGLGTIAQASVMARAAEARSDQINALNAKSDADLAKMHLRRDEIAAYVFRDLMYV